MLLTKFRGNWPAGSGEEDFEQFLPYIEGLGKNYRNSILSTFSTTQKLIYFFRMISGKSEFGIYAG